MNGPEAGLAVIQALRFVEHDERVAVHVRGVGVLGEPTGAARLNRPGTRPHEALARHGCESGEDRRRGDAIEAAQLFGIKAPRGFDGIGHERCGSGDPHYSRSGDRRYNADYRRVDSDDGRVGAWQFAERRSPITRGSNVNANDYEFAITKPDSIQR